MRLADTDNTMLAVLVHPLLQAKHFSDHEQLLILTTIQCSKARMLAKLINSVEIASQITQLLTDTFANLLVTDPFVFGN
ncbi:hypothetical protein [Desulfogranum marinum]|uniref:hypothetical protein n=1 Tax=Desulfogranum marinum TaxID=453220 RepID=UPI00196320BD|nr:hypothetical protein [Desulfogranum marinum]MBM9515144.1 hypothetical protein [Desulfogranum marinum]